MKAIVQLGLLCLGLLISSLHGEVETDYSKEMPIKFEEPDLDQPEMYRVRRQTVSTEKDDTAKTEVVVTSSANGKMKKGKRPRAGAFSPLGHIQDSEIKFRTKRQNKNKKKQKNPRPGSLSLLSMGNPQHTARAKRDENGAGKIPWLGS